MKFNHSFLILPLLVVFVEASYNRSRFDSDFDSVFGRNERGNTLRGKGSFNGYDKDENVENEFTTVTRNSHSQSSSDDSQEWTQAQNRKSNNSRQNNNTWELNKNSGEIMVGLAFLAVVSMIVSLIVASRSDK